MLPTDQSPQMFDVHSFPRGVELTPEYIAWLKERLYIHPEHPQLIVWLQILTITPDKQNIMFDKYAELIDQIHPKPYDSIVELTSTKRPDPDVREVLRSRLSGLPSKPRHCCLITKKSFMLNAVTRFAAAAMGLGSISIHDTISEAVDYYASKFP